MSSPLFQKQEDRKHILESLLIALSFTSTLESKYVQSVVSGFVGNEQFYVNNQRIRGWFNKQGNLLLLTEKAKRLVQLSPFEIIVNRREVNRLTNHEVQLVRSLFLCLLHLDFAHIKQIKKQKVSDNSPYIPDLSIVTKTDTLLIEVDTGSQPFKTLETKIRGYKAYNMAGTLIYFTDSTTDSHFSQSQGVQFINLKSPTLADDLQKLSSTSRQAINTTLSTTQNPVLQALNSNLGSNLNLNSDPNLSGFLYPELTALASPLTQKATIKLAHNIFVFNQSLDPKTAYLEQRRGEIDRLLIEDD